MVGQERDGRFHGHRHNPANRQRLGGVLAGSFDAGLHRRDFVRMRSSYVVLLVGVFGQVVEVSGVVSRESPHAVGGDGLMRSPGTGSEVMVC